MIPTLSISSLVGTVWDGYFPVESLLPQRYCDVRANGNPANFVVFRVSPVDIVFGLGPTIVVTQVALINAGNYIARDRCVNKLLPFHGVC